MKVAIISIALPPSQSGQSQALFQILNGVEPDSFCLITQKNSGLYHLQGNCSKKLPIKYHFLSPDNKILQKVIRGLLLLRLDRFFNTLMRFRAEQIKRILVREGCTAVIACTGDLFDPPAALLASKELGIPFILYIFDYYSRQWTDGAMRKFAEAHECDLVKSAAQVIVPNECMQAEYLKLYGVRAHIIHNPCDIVEYEQNIHISDTLEEGDIRIVYTGAVYDAHYSAFHNLLVAIRITEIQGLLLHLYTPQSEIDLNKSGIVGPVVIHRHLPNEEMPDIQRGADILFLPLAFNSPYPEVIKTSAPGKVGEYLAAKRPVLVHAPQGSFVSWYFKKYRCGLVVDEDDPQELAQAIEHLLSDERFNQEILQNAYCRAELDFDARHARELFLQILNELPS